MNQAAEPFGTKGGDLPTPPLRTSLRDHLWPAVSSVIALTIVSGVAFPVVLWALGSVLFPHQTRGSLLVVRGVVAGSGLIGQDFKQPGYFHPRPSAAGAGYDASSSSGTNLGPNNPKLKDAIRLLAEAYRSENGLAPETLIPIAAVTRSASGLDPHISPENAALQIARVARSRGLSEDAVRNLVADYTKAPQLGFMGGARVSVLELNLALDRK